MADGRSTRPHIANERREVRLQVIPSPPLELFHKIAGPVLIVNLQAIAEDRVRRIVGTESLHQPIADRAQVVFGGGAIHMVKHETLAADGRPLHLHSRAARNEKHHFVRPVEVGRKRNCAAFNLRQLADAVGDEIVPARAHQ